MIGQSGLNHLLTEGYELFCPVSGVVRRCRDMDGMGANIRGASGPGCF